MDLEFFKRRRPTKDDIIQFAGVLMASELVVMGVNGLTGNHFDTASLAAGAVGGVAIGESIILAVSPAQSELAEEEEEG